MSNHSQLQKVIDTIKELSKTSGYCCIGLKVAEIMVTKLMYFILPDYIGMIVPMAVEDTFQKFAIDSTSAALLPPDTLKGNLDIFQEKIMQDFRSILLTPYSGVKDFCYTLLGCPVSSIAALAGLAIYLAIISAIEAIIIALLILSVVGLIVASPFSPKLRGFMTKENVGIFGRTALVMLSVFPALTPFVTAALLSIVSLSITSIFTRAGANIHSMVDGFSSSPGPV